MMRMGVPPEYRGSVWMEVSGAAGEADAWGPRGDFPPSSQPCTAPCMPLMNIAMQATQLVIYPTHVALVLQVPLPPHACNCPLHAHAAMQATKPTTYYRNLADSEQDSQALHQIELVWGGARRGGAERSGGKRGGKGPKGPSRLCLPLLVSLRTMATRLPSSLPPSPQLPTGPSPHLPRPSLGGGRGGAGGPAARTGRPVSALQGGRVLPGAELPGRHAAAVHRQGVTRTAAGRVGGLTTDRSSIFCTVAPRTRTAFTAPPWCLTAHFWCSPPPCRTRRLPSG